MEEKIKNILDDLYAIDSGFRKQEKELREIVARLLASRPDTKFSNGFKHDLQHQLLQEISAMNNESRGIINNFNFMKKIAYMAGGAVLASLFILPVIYFTPLTPLAPQNKLLTENQKMFAQKIEKLSGQAFGSLRAAESAAERSSAPMGLEEGGGGGAPAIAPMMADSKAQVIGRPMPVPPEEWTSYRFVYMGETLEIEEDFMDVLKRVKGELGGADMTRIFNSMDLGLIDLSTFANAKVQSFNILEDKDRGYSVDVNIPEGMISINQYWQRWPQPLYKCLDGANCAEQNRIKESDIPKDDELISIADNFVKAHKISLGNYGKPEVVDQWRVYYMMAPDKASFYFPESVAVLYPLRVNNMNVYDEQGNKVGINVNIDVREMRVSGVWNITSQSYQSSSYKTEKDIDKILALAEKGGIYGYFDPNAPKVAEVELGEPELALMKMWNYKDGKGEELLVPAFAFPIVKKPDSAQYFYQKTVIVPVIADILENSSGSGPIRIMEDTVKPSMAQ